MTKDLLQQALDALLEQKAVDALLEYDYAKTNEADRSGSAAIYALRVAIAQPVAPINTEGDAIIAGALFDFMGMLTSQDEKTRFSSTDEAGPAVEQIERFALKRGLSLENADVKGWRNRLAAIAQLEQHEFFTDADANRPSQICDRNGQVVLQQCKKCGLAESELTDSPLCNKLAIAQPEQPDRDLQHAHTMNQFKQICKGKNCNASLVNWTHSPECVAEHDAAIGFTQPEQATAQRKRQPLTEEQLRECFCATNTSEPLSKGWPGLKRFARAVEAAHGIPATPQLL